MTVPLEPSVESGFADLRVRDAMVARPNTLPADTTVAVARSGLDSDRVHQLLIVDEDRLLGTLEREDLDSAPGTSLAAAYARLEGRTVTPDRPLDEVHAEMVATGRRRLAVVDDEGTLLGLLCLKRKLHGFCSDEGVAARAADRHRA